jgi:general secretion pathway protein C
MNFVAYRLLPTSREPHLPMLDLFFKKYLWTANLALLLAAAWLSAKTVNVVAGSLIRPTPMVDAAALSVASAPPPTPTPIEAERLFPLIGQTPPAAPESTDDASAGAASTARNCDDPAASATRTSLRAQLVAAVLAERSQWSIASITDLSSRETRIYGVGDQLLGAKLLGVERIRDERDATGSGFKVAAVLCNNGSKEYLDFDSESGSTPTTNLGVFNPGPGSAGGPGGGAPMDGVKKVTDNRYEIQRNVIDSTLSNLNNIATQARIVPSFKNGVANGFKLFSIQPGSLYSSIGVENGDVIQKINGYEINSPDKALEIYQKLRESSHISLEIERNGQVVRKEYNISGQ